jgi:hypothetical protein
MWVMLLAGIGNRGGASMAQDVRMDRLESALERLARAQARMDAAVLTLTREVDRLRQSLGPGLDEVAPEIVPWHLARHHLIHVQDLEARVLSMNGGEVQIDLYGEGHQDGRRVVVIGAMRSRIRVHDVESAVELATRLRPQLPGAPVPVLFGFVVYPSAHRRAQELGAIVIAASTPRESG